MKYTAHIHIERTPWSDDDGVGHYSESELVTSEDIEPRKSLVVLLSTIDYIAGRKLNLNLVDGEPDQADASWIDDGWLYDLRVSFAKVEPFNFADWLASTP